MGCECHASGRAVCVCVRTHGVPEVLQRYAHPGAPSPKSERYRRPLRRPILPGVRPSVPRSGRLCVCACVSSRSPFVCVQQEQQEEDREVFRFSPLPSLSLPLSLLRPRPTSNQPLPLTNKHTPRHTGTDVTHTALRHLLQLLVALWLR